jgi:hypothetical protein
VEEIAFRSLFRSPFEPGFTGEAHLRRELEDPVRFHVGHPPRIDGVLQAHVLGVASTPLQPDSPNEHVEDSPELPCPFVPVIPDVATDAAEGPEEIRRVGLGPDDLAVDEQRTAAPRWIAFEGASRTGGGIGPAGVDPKVRAGLQSPLDSLTERHRLNVEMLLGCRAVHDHLVSERIDEGTGDTHGEWGHEPDPQ